MKRTQGEWVNRNEELPEQSGEVFVRFKSRGVGLTNCGVSWFRKESGSFDGEDVFRKVAFWMPVPPDPVEAT